MTSPDGLLCHEQKQFTLRMVVVVTGDVEEEPECEQCGGACGLRVCWFCV